MTVSHAENISNSTPKIPRCYFVYILSSLKGTLYVGLTDDLRKRILEHKAGTLDGFTKKYNITRLMYFETINLAKAAEKREEQIKKYRREKKIALFEGSNPKWRDMTPEIFQSIRSGRYDRGVWG